jgi:predicted Zn-dependent protease
MLRRPLLVLVAITFTAAVLGCATSRLVTPSGETKLGGELAQQVEQTMGLVTDAKVASYVASVGERLVSASDSVRGSLEYRFHVIDMEAPNAFALPGGYIYVSRGLLALLQTEAELANVLAHEIAHVSARHHLRHAVRQTPFVPLKIATGIGALASGIVSPLLGRAVATLGNAPGQLVLATYSRGQESQADELGQGYAAAAGWNPGAMARVMEALASDTTRRGGDPHRRSYLATHPTSPDRAQKTTARAKTLSVDAAPGLSSDRRDFLHRLEGLLVGGAARHGVIAAPEYLHPTLDFHLTFPDGWELTQDDHSVRAVAPEKNAMVLLTLAGEGDDPEKVAKEVLQQVRFDVEQGPTTRWGEGRTGTYATARYDRQGKRYRYALAWLAHGGRVYQISAGAHLDSWESRRAVLEAVAPSFRALRASDSAKLREGRLRVVGAMGRSLDALMPPDGAWSIEEASVANGIGGDAPSTRDGWYKIAPLEPYVPAPDES